METSLQPQIRVLLADDDRGSRTLLRHALKAHPNLVVLAAEAKDGHEAVTLAQEHQPDLVIMDLNMPRVDGVEATARIASVVPAAKVIIFSATREPQLIDAAFAAGAIGYVAKKDIAQIRPAIDAARRGRLFFSA